MADRLQVDVGVWYMEAKNASSCGWNVRMNGLL
jgi:hypothetical protein